MKLGINYMIFDFFSFYSCGQLDDDRVVHRSSFVNSARQMFVVLLADDDDDDDDNRVVEEGGREVLEMVAMRWSIVDELKSKEIRKNKLFVIQSKILSK